MIAKFYKGLTSDSRAIREEVFVKEQGFKEEFDKLDDYVDTLVLYDDDMNAVATGRLYEVDVQSHTFKLGRIAVLREYRHLRLGSHVIKCLEDRAKMQGAKRYYISAQVVAKPFYEHNGYVAYGTTYYEEHVEHISMEKIVK